MSKRDELAAVPEEHEAVGWMLNSRGEQGWTCCCGSVVDLPPEHHAHVADAVLAWLGEQFDEVMRRLGLSDAAQDAQDGARTASEVGSGSECHLDAARPGESRRESENER